MSNPTREHVNLNQPAQPPTPEQVAEFRRRARLANEARDRVLADRRMTKRSS